jgi:hypothetical protein
MSGVRAQASRGRAARRAEAALPGLRQELEGAGAVPPLRDDIAEARPSSRSATARTPSPSAAAPRGPWPRRPVVDTAAKAGPQPVAFPLRLLAWAVALVLGLLLTGWLARVSGWLSGDRLVDVFTGTGGMERYLRVLALAPAWAVVTTLLLTLFLEGGRALARRRNAVRAARGESRRGNRRARPPQVDPSVDLERDGAVGDGLRRRGAARRGSR